MRTPPGGVGGVALGLLGLLRHSSLLYKKIWIYFLKDLCGFTAISTHLVRSWGVIPGLNLPVGVVPALSNACTVRNCDLAWFSRR